MGHLINPISTRLGFTSFWISTWSSYSLFDFSYNLMVDNAIRKLILWSFSDSSVGVQLSTIGIFLSHFKIIRRAQRICVFVFMVLDSSKILKSQSIEKDPNVAGLENELFLKNQTLNPYSENKKFLFINNVSKTLSSLYSILSAKVIFEKFVSQLLSETFSKFFLLNKHFNDYNISLNLCFLRSMKFISAQFLSRFISRRLSFGFELGRVLAPIVSDLTKLIDSNASKVAGFRISCSGRFNKTQMASYSWEKYGPIPLNNFSSLVDYSFSKVFMRYGLCGIKVWIFTFSKPFKIYKSNILKKYLNLNTLASLFASNSLVKTRLDFWFNLSLKFFFLDILYELPNRDFLQPDSDNSSLVSFFLDFVSFCRNAC